MLGDRDMHESMEQAQEDEEEGKGESMKFRLALA